MTAHPDWCDITIEHHHVNDPLRDADRVLAHSLADEAYRRPTYDWYRPSMGEQISQAIGCAAQMLAILIVAILLWAFIFGLFAVATNV